MTIKVTSQINSELDHYSNHITRIEAHLTDENGKKTGKGDKRCLLEARIEGKQPVAVTNYADSNESALTGAIDKFVRMLDTIFDKAKNHR